MPIQEEQVSHVIHANPMPQFDKVFKPQLPHRAIDTQPFDFEERYRDKPTRETLVQQILQKEKVQWFLHPLRIFIVIVSVCCPCIQFYCYISLPLYMCTLQKPEFKAQPLPDFVMGPSLPPKSVQPPTKVEPFNLKTEERGHQHSTRWLQKVCVISQLMCPWWYVYSVMVELPICIWGDRILIYRLKKSLGRQSWRQNSRPKKPLFSTQSHLLP